MNDKEINDTLRKWENDDSKDQYVPSEWRGSDKVVPYIGWYWREVDFSNRVSLGYIPPEFDDNATGLVGFMENNKWGYPEFGITDQQRDAIRGMIVDLITAPSKEQAQALCDYMQALVPTWIVKTDWSCLRED